MNINARTAITLLLKGLFYKSDNENAWDELIEGSYGAISDYFEIMGLEVMTDENEGFSYLQNMIFEEGEESLPKLIRSRELSYKVSLVCVLLRKKIADFDIQNEDTKAIVTNQEIKDMVLLFLPSKTNEVKTLKEIDTSIKKVQELGFLRLLKNQDGVYEIKRSIKAFVDAQWLNELDIKLQEYREVES
ncbi:DUF4194 domain-containing protein [Sulfurimonas sp.]|uniref:DUF4194 domain-containing protein n=1 Tax=Sulfurimonas sp. TaxID=2022749 RepID=UPI002B45BD8D|nr:DUF4194 domain-containing protein [Sulfurimonas sp.]